MIAKIIEMDILDAAWLEITRAHPELLLASDGAPLSLKANYALKNTCTPSSVIEQPFLANSLVEAQGFLFMTTLTTLVLADPATGAVLQSLLLKPSAAGVVPDVVRASPLWIAAISAPLTGDRILRLCLCAITEEDDVPPVVEEAGKKAPPKKGAAVEAPPPAKKVGRCQVSVVEVRLGAAESFKSPTLIKMTLMFVASVPLPNPTRADVKSLDLSIDTEVICLATPKGCHLFSLPTIEDLITKTGLSMENINEDAEGENDEADDEKPPVLLEPFLVLDTERDFGGKIVKHAALCPLVSATKPINKPPAPPVVVSGPSSRVTVTSNGSPFYKTALALIFETATEWTLLGLRGASSETLVSTAEPTIAVTSAPLSQWFLAAGVSALTFDEGKTLMILGFLDGSLSMWNLATRVCTAVEGRHETAVTSLCLSRSDSAERGVSNYNLLTGAEDGTLCFFSINQPRTNLDSFYALSMSDNAAPVCLSANFIAFRLDVDPGCSIVNIRSLRNLPVAVVQCSDGLSILYDLQGAKLLGRLLLYSGIMSKQIKWHIATCEEIVSASLLSEECSTPEVQPTDTGTGAIVQESPAALKPLPLLLKRAPKYAISSSIEGGSNEALDSVATASHIGWHAIYFRDDSPVLASFRLDDMLPVLFPGLASVCGDVGQMVQMFNTLGVEERQDANMANSRIASLGRLHEDDFASFKAKAVSRGTGGSGSGPGAKVKTPGSTSAQRRGSETNRHRHSKTGLPGGMFGVSSVGNDATLSKNAWDRISEPSQVAAKSASKSSADRVSRKMRLLNQLGDLSASF